MNKKTLTFSYVTMLSAMAIIINIVESIFIPPLQFGIRFGLANIVSLITIYLFGIKEMLIVNSMRLIVANILKGMIFSSTFWISGTGIVLSSLFLVVFYFMKSSLFFESIMSALAHSFGQLIAVSFLYNNVNMFSIFPLLTFSSIATGMLTGYIAKMVLTRIKVKT